jgi:hypothetical protein
VITFGYWIVGQSNNAVYVELVRKTKIYGSRFYYCTPSGSRGNNWPEMSHTIAYPIKLSGCVKYAPSDKERPQHESNAKWNVKRYLIIDEVSMLDLLINVNLNVRFRDTEKQHRDPAWGDEYHRRFFATYCSE